MSMLPKHRTLQQEIETWRAHKFAFEEKNKKEKTSETAPKKKVFTLPLLPIPKEKLVAVFVGMTYFRNEKQQEPFSTACCCFCSDGKNTKMNMIDSFYYKHLMPSNQYWNDQNAASVTNESFFVSSDHNNPTKKAQPYILNRIAIIDWFNQNKKKLQLFEHVLFYDLSYQSNEELKKLAKSNFESVPLCFDVLCSIKHPILFLQSLNP